MGALIPLALTIAPELARWLFGATAEKTTTAVTQAVQAATGTTDPESAAAILQRDPAVAVQLRLQLAQLAAEQESVTHANEIQSLAAVGSNQRGAPNWAAPIVSGLVLLTFAAVMVLVLVCGVPPGTDTVANMLLGTLAAMATSVVSYWVGSSAGSARKDERLAQATRLTP